MPGSTAPPTSARPGHAPGYLAVLRVPGLPAVCLAHAVSISGTVAATVALSVLVYQRSGSALLSALVLTCSFVPYAIGGSALSAIADRFPARRVLVGCDLISAAAVALMLLPGMPVAGLLGLLLVAGTVAPVFQGARSASLAQLLGTDGFAAGRSLLRVISQGAVLAGFAAGGLAVAAVGARWLIAADALSFAVSAAVLRFATATSAVRPDAPGSPRELVRASADGMRFVLGHDRLRRLLVLSWCAAGFSAAFDGAAVAYAVQTGAGATAAGTLFTAYGAGIVLGEILLARVQPTIRLRMVVPLILLNQLPLLFFAAVPAIWLAALILVAAGAGCAVSQSIDPRMLAATPPARLGQVFTVQTSGLMAAQGLGIAVAGAFAGVLLPSTVIAACGAVGSVVLVVLARAAAHS